MLSSITIFGQELATYSLFAIISIIIGFLVAIFYFSKFNSVKKEDIFYAGLFGVIGVGIGAKILYIVTQIPLLFQNPNNILELLSQMITGGFVFYGGLIGGIIGILIYSKIFKISFRDLLIIYTPVLPLAHSISRIGCFFAGCCYGIEYNGFGSVVFHNTVYAPVNIPLLPTQLIESFFNFLIFIILLLTYKKFKNTYKSLGLYFVLYSILRFIIEFFRGDQIRGFLFSLSTSAWISIFLFIIGIKILLKKSE